MFASYNHNGLMYLLAFVGVVIISLCILTYVKTTTNIEEIGRKKFQTEIRQNEEIAQLNYQFLGEKHPEYTQLTKSICTDTSKLNRNITLINVFPDEFINGIETDGYNTKDLPILFTRRKIIITPDKHNINPNVFKALFAETYKQRILYSELLFAIETLVINVAGSFDQIEDQFKIGDSGSLFFELLVKLKIDFIAGNGLVTEKNVFFILQESEHVNSFADFINKKQPLTQTPIEFITKVLNYIKEGYLIIRKEECDILPFLLYTYITYSTEERYNAYQSIKHEFIIQSKTVDFPETSLKVEF